MAILTIDQLPNELIASILSFLDGPSTLERRLYHDPAKIMNADDEDDEEDDDDDRSCEQTERFRGSIKSASLVCHLWRRCALPILFRHIVWKFESINRPLPSKDALSAVQGLEFLRFLRREQLTRHVEGLTIIIDYPEECAGDDLPFSGRWGILPSHFPATSRHEEQEPPLLNCRLWGNNWLWHTLFVHLDLLRITLVSSPSILASLLGRPIDLDGAWVFRQRFHILSLSRPGRTPPQKQPWEYLPSKTSPTSDSPLPTVPCDLFSIQDWTSLLLNEGSSVKVYSTYEYFNHPPPSLLPALLDASDPSMRPLLTSTLRSLSYIAIFPLSTHINDVLIPRIPAIDRFYIQIVPRALSFADADYRRPALDISDLWMERNTAYAHLVMAIFDQQPLGAWAGLRVFESGDAADQEGWEQAVRYVVFSAGARWKVAGEGVFVRQENTPGSLSPS